MKSLAFIILSTISVGSTISNGMNQMGENLGRIARGHDAKVAQFPYTVRMSIRHEKFVDLCGGALIGVNWILTAAHCFNKALAVAVYLGSLYLNDAKVAYNVPLGNIIIHENFDMQYLIYDIALVYIPTTDLCSRIGIIPLPKIQVNYPTYENDVAVGTGWGIINDENTFPKILQWGYMKILTNSKCRNVQIRPNEMCTAMSLNWATACKGDSGGPLVLESTYELIGITSSGSLHSCLNGQAVVYTRVTSYLDWIKSVSGISY